MHDECSLLAAIAAIKAPKHRSGRRNAGAFDACYLFSGQTARLQRQVHPCAGALDCYLTCFAAQVSAQPASVGPPRRLN